MFRFTIRDLLWLTVVVALGVGWWVDRVRSAQQRDQVQQQAEFLVGVKLEIEREKNALRETEMRLREGWGQSLIDRTGFTPSPLLNDSPSIEKPTGN